MIDIWRKWWYKISVFDKNTTEKLNIDISLLQVKSPIWLNDKIVTDFQNQKSTSQENTLPY